MKKTTAFDCMLDTAKIELARLGDSRPAGLWITSLPWPRRHGHPISLNSAPTYTRGLGQWPEEPAGTPRRLLMVADGGTQAAPDTLSLADGCAEPAGTPPTAECECFERSPDPYFGWERSRLRIRHQGRSLALAMGLRTGGEWHWWEACRLVVVEETPTCRVVEMGGAIPLVHSTKHSGKDGHYRNPWLHKHHWLYGSMRVRMHANGVCEVFARHINSMYVDEGTDLKPAVPTIAFWADGDGGQTMPPGLDGAWDGSRSEFAFGPARFDVTEVARLATPEHPGRMDWVGGALVWQPYQGCELYGGICSSQRSGDGYILRAEEETILRGMSRTLRFSLSLSDRPPRVARYLAPPWWYGLCEEFTPAPLLPVYGGTEERMDECRRWLMAAHNKGGFEDGGVPRHGDPAKAGLQRMEPGWEGEIPYAQFLTAWRYGDAADYDLAMRSAYHFHDVIIDHAANLVRMHGYAPIAFALPMNRVQGPLAAFLETGDDFLFDSAEKVVEAANRMHRNAWPRMAVGRDACYVRSAVLLYRYTGSSHFLRIAREGAMAVAQSQRPNGSFGDQGGGTGIHQWGGYISKPWMGLLATNGVLDYLEVVGDDAALLDCVRRFADWLMAERTDRGGVLSWGYQHDYWGTRRHQQNPDDEVETLPSKPLWHQDNIARLMGYCALRFNRADYLDAWAESFAGYAERGIVGDHTASASLQFLPWLQSALWRATLGPDGELCVAATAFGPRTFPRATIQTPDGPCDLAWMKNGHVKADPGIKLAIRALPGGR